MTVERCIAENLRVVKDRIADACARSGRDPAGVTLVAVTKSAQPEWIRALVLRGQTELGENRPQQLAARAREIVGPARWHLIGPLQRNKVRLVLPIASVIHAAESIRLLEAIERVAGELQLNPRVLLEVNLSGEPAKHGFSREELLRAWDQVAAFGRLRIEGLMTMAAYSPRPDDARPVFAALRDLRDELRQRAPPGVRLGELSMGMSGDFEAAIAEGATLVRIGSALWEGLT